MSAIRIERSRGAYTDSLRKYKVIIDGDVVGKVRRGEEKSFPVAPGEHWVRLKIDWGSSQPVDVSLAEGQEVSLYCEPRAKPWTILYWMTFGRNRYITLRPA